jgi:hypothetical protein
MMSSGPLLQRCLRTKPYGRSGRYDERVPPDYDRMWLVDPSDAEVSMGDRVERDDDGNEVVYRIVKVGNYVDGDGVTYTAVYGKRR